MRFSSKFSQCSANSLFHGSLFHGSFRSPTWSTAHSQITRVWAQFLIGIQWFLSNVCLEYDLQLPTVEVQYRIFISKFRSLQCSPTNSSEYIRYQLLKPQNLWRSVWSSSSAMAYQLCAILPLLVASKYQGGIVHLDTVNSEIGPVDF